MFKVQPLPSLSRLIIRVQRWKDLLPWIINKLRTWVQLDFRVQCALDCTVVNIVRHGAGLVLFGHCFTAAKSNCNELLNEVTLLVC